MPKLPASASKEAKRERMKEEMDKWKAGEMHSGTGRKGQKREEPVTDQKQAVAIALSESGQSKKDRAKRRKTRGGRSHARR